MRTTVLLCALMIVAVPALPLVNADQNPLPIRLQELVCGYPAVKNAFDQLPDTAGRCDGGRYSQPLFEPPPCTGCMEEQLVVANNLTLLRVPALQEVEGPGITLAHEGGRYCFRLTSKSGSLQQCLDAGPASLLLPDAIIPNPTDPVLAANATIVDVNVSYHWNEDRLHQRLGPGIVERWEPVDLDDPAEVTWWLDHANQTTVSVNLTLRTEQESLAWVQVYLPFAGQAIAAVVRDSSIDDNKIRPVEPCEQRPCGGGRWYFHAGGNMTAEPGTRMEGDPQTFHIEQHDGPRFSQTLDLEQPLRIAAKDSFRLILANRSPVFPGTAAYTTSITVSLEGNGQRIVLASGNFTSEQSNEVGGTVSGLTGEDYQQVRTTVQRNINTTLANLNGNPLYSTIQSQFSNQCSKGYDDTGMLCGPLYGDYGRGTSLRPCREWKGGPLNPLVPILTNYGVCTTYTARGLAIFAANESGPLVEGAISNGTEVMLGERMNASQVAYTAVNSTSFLNPSSPTELSWSHFLLDVNDSLVDAGGGFTAPAGTQLKVEFYLRADGLIEEVGNLSVGNRYGEVLRTLSPALDVIPESAPLFPGLRMRENVTKPYFGTEATVNGTTGRVANPGPLAHFTYDRLDALSRLEVAFAS